MKTILLRRNSPLTFLAALGVLVVVAIGCGQMGNRNASTGNANGAAGVSEDPNRDPDMPDDRLLKALVKETTADFAYAISTEDFSKMYKKTSPDFQKQYNPDQMKDVFKGAIANKKALLPMLAKIVSMDPTISPEPQIRNDEGIPILVVRATYDVQPKPLIFNYEYVKRNGVYRLLKLVVGDENPAA